MPSVKVREFFRKINREILKSYFDKNEIPYEGVDLLTTTDENFHILVENLETEFRTLVIEDFSQVVSLSDEAGISVIFDTAIKLNKEFLVSELGSVDGEYNKALYVLINHKDVVDYAQRVRFYSDLKMHVEVDGLNKIEITDPKVYEEKLKTRVSEYLVSVESRGEKCLVDSYKGDDHICFMLYPIDHTKIDLDYDKDSEQLKPFTYKPAFKIAYSYYPDKGILQISTPFQGDKQGQLLNIFNEVVLDDKTDISKAGFVYNLNKILDEDFKISVDAEDGISSCFLKELRVRLKTGELLSINLDYKNVSFEFSIDDMLDSLKRRNLTKDAIDSVQFASFRFGFHVSTGFTVGHARIGKNGCNLNDTAKDKIIKKYLIKWGLRTRVVEDEEEQQG